MQKKQLFSDSEEENQQYSNSIQKKIQKNKKHQQFSKEIFEGQKGKVLLELQKTFQGDERFKLDRRFKDDVEINKLPLLVKQQVQNEDIDLELDKQPTKPQKTKHSNDNDDDGYDYQSEKQQYLDILNQVMPGIQKSIQQLQKHNQQQQKVQQNNSFKGLLIPRYQPDQQKTHNLIVKKHIMTEKEKQKAAEEKKKQNMIKAGIDKEKQKLMKANYILGKTLNPDKQMEEVKRSVQIDKSTWKSIIGKQQDLSNFSLFS